MEIKEFTAKTIAEAIRVGLEEMGLTEDQADVEVLEEPTRGILGIGSKKAKVRISKKKTDGERANDFVNGLFEIINMPATTELQEDENGIVINVITTTSSSVIGYRGEVLDAIQCLAGAVANTGKVCGNMAREHVYMQGGSWAFQKQQIGMCTNVPS